MLKQPTHKKNTEEVKTNSIDTYQLKLTGMGRGEITNKSR